MKLEGWSMTLNFLCLPLTQRNIAKSVASMDIRKLIDSIKLARSLGEQPSIIATATPDSIGHMERVIKLAQEMNTIVLLGPVFDFCENELLREEGIKEVKRLGQMDNVCVNWAFLEFYLERRQSDQEAALPSHFFDNCRFT